MGGNSDACACSSCCVVPVCGTEYLTQHSPQHLIQVQRTSVRACLSAWKLRRTLVALRGIQAPTLAAQHEASKKMAEAHTNIEPKGNQREGRTRASFSCACGEKPRRHFQMQRVVGSKVVTFYLRIHASTAVLHSSTSAGSFSAQPPHQSYHPSISLSSRSPG